jgi:hypothetical protein
MIKKVSRAMVSQLRQMGQRSILHEALGQGKLVSVEANN